MRRTKELYLKRVMEVICIHCERTRNINDCWCCIDKGKRHYECKENPDCESIKQEKKKQEEKTKPVKVEPQKKEEEVAKKETFLQPMEIEDWVHQSKIPTFLSSFLSLFSNPYSKVKNE